VNPQPRQAPSEQITPARLDTPRLGYVPRAEHAQKETRIRVVYRIDIPLRPGRVIDVLA